MSQSSGYHVLRRTEHHSQHFWVLEWSNLNSTMRDHGTNSS